MTNQESELSDDIHERVLGLAAEGDALVEDEAIPDALKKYWEAWELLPEPKKKWQAATWLLTAIGDANFFNSDFSAGRDSLTVAMDCPDAVGNPFIHLRLGQCQFELKNMERAKLELCRAYMGGGEEIFEDEDPKYFEFVSEILKLDPTS